MPEVSYVKAIDVWTLACIVFIFGTILEYIVVLRYASPTFVSGDSIKHGIRYPETELGNRDMFISACLFK